MIKVKFTKEEKKRIYRIMLGIERMREINKRFNLDKNNVFKKEVKNGYDKLD